MKSVLYGITSMFIISLVAWAVTGSISTSSGEKHVSKNDSVRLD